MTLANRRLGRSVKVAVLAVLFLSCRSAVKQEQGNFVDGESDTILLGEKDDGKVPAFLWSPSQRKMSAAYYFLTSEYMSMSGDLAPAANLLEQAYSLDPNPFLGGKLIAAKVHSESPGELLSDARRMVLMYPNFYRLRLYYAQILARAGKNEEAIKSLEEGIRLNGTDEQLYLELVEIYQRLRNPTKALVIARDLVRNVPGSIPGWLVLAKLYVVTAQKKDALGAAERAYEMQSSNPESILVYALALELNNQSQKAISLYENLYRMNPANEELVGRMIALYRQLGDLNVALELLDELSKLPAGKSPGVQIQRAIILWELKRNKEAATILQELASDYPTSERVSYLAGLAQEKIDDKEAALKFYESVPTDASLRLESDFRRSVILKGQKKYQLALGVIDATLEKDGASWEYYALAAEIHSENKDNGSAISLVELGYQKFPKRHRLLFLKGVYQEKNGEIDDCIETMRAVIKLEPTNSSALNYLGYLFTERGKNLDEAIELISQAIKIKPDDPYYIDSLGWAYFQKGQLKKAETTLLAALKIAPTEGVILEHLAEVAWKQNQKDKAKSFYIEAIKTKLESRDRKRIESRYEELFGKN